MQRSNDHITSIEEASLILDWDPQAIRIAARQGKLTFATAIAPEKGSVRTYYVDTKTLELCKQGKKELFRA